MTYYALDRSPATVAQLGHARIVAFTVQAARYGYVLEAAGHRQRAGAGEAARLCRLWYGIKLADALAGGVV